MHASIKHFGLRHNIAVFSPPAVLCAILLAALLQLPGASPDQLKWLLQPTAWGTSLISGSSFSFVPGSGYLSHDGRILLAAECAGGRFFVIAVFAGLFIAPRKNICDRRFRPECRKIALTLILAYLITISANVSRIATILTAEKAFAALSLPGLINSHEFLGALTYFTWLVMLTTIRGYLR